MKRALIAIAAVVSIGLLGLQMATAQPGGMMGRGMGPGYGPCGGPGGKALTEEEIKAHDAFLDKTTELRKKLVMKRAEMKAVMHSENPDGKKAAKLSGELFELRNQLRQKAKESGLKTGYGNCGCGMGGGMGGGMGHGRHMKGRW